MHSWWGLFHVPAQFQCLIFSLAVFHTHDTDTHRCARTPGSVYNTQAITFVVDLIVVQNRHCQVEKDVNAEAFITVMRRREINNIRHKEYVRLACGT